jgi:KDO2-lipid IV(A) lauroyltransferase
LVRYEGSENLARAREHGRGVFLLGGHYTTLELSGRLMCLFTNDINPIYKPASNAVFNLLMTRYRSRIYDNLLSNTDMRAMLRALKQGKIIWYAPDQDFGRRRSVFAPFMGVSAATLTMTSRLAQRAGAPVLPFYSERLPGTRGYEIRVGPPLENFPSGDDVADATAINQAIEVQVRRTPEQYLWGHRRFKTRPPGERKLY